MIRWSSAAVSKSSLLACAPPATSGLRLLMRAEAEHGDYLERLTTAIRQPTNQDQCPSRPSCTTTISWSIWPAPVVSLGTSIAFFTRVSQAILHLHPKQPASLHRAMCRPPDRRSSLDVCRCLVVEAIPSGSRLVPTPPECSSAPASRLTSPPMLCVLPYKTPSLSPTLPAEGHALSVLSTSLSLSPCSWACPFESFDHRRSLSVPLASFELMIKLIIC